MFIDFLSRSSVDGSDRGLSGVIYKSIHGRDRFGMTPVCDISWLANKEEPANPLNVGQIVNNAGDELRSNVTYHELDLQDFDPKLAVFLPNNDYELAASLRTIRIVPLIATREIQVNEELLSSYYSLVS